MALRHAFSNYLAVPCLSQFTAIDETRRNPSINVCVFIRKPSWTLSPVLPSIFFGKFAIHAKAPQKGFGSEPKRQAREPKPVRRLPKKDVAWGRVLEMENPEDSSVLECFIRSSFKSSTGVDCYILQPLDLAVRILIENKYNEMEDPPERIMDRLISIAATALLERRVVLRRTPFCLTIRGGLMFDEREVLSLGEEEAIEICTFDYDGKECLVLAPVAPLIFVGCKDEASGRVCFADKVMEDPIVVEELRKEQELVENEQLLAAFDEVDLPED